MWPRPRWHKPRRRRPLPWRRHLPQPRPHRRRLQPPRRQGGTPGGHREVRARQRATAQRRRRHPRGQPRRRPGRRSTASRPAPTPRPPWCCATARPWWSAPPRGSTSSSSISTRTTQDGGMLVSLLRGTLRMVTGLIGKTHPDAVRVETQTAVIGIRGTDFIVQAGRAAVMKTSTSTVLPRIPSPAPALAALLLAACSTPGTRVGAAAAGRRQAIRGGGPHQGRRRNAVARLTSGPRPQWRARGAGGRPGRPAERAGREQAAVRADARRRRRATPCTSKLGGTVLTPRIAESP